MNIFKDYFPKSSYLVCVDSDGCAMDTMDVKHTACFAPQWISVFGLEDRHEEAFRLWLDINLHTATRGINRFAGLCAVCEEMVRRGAVIEDLESLTEWVTHTGQLSNPVLEEYLDRHPSLCLAKALAWSKQVNAAITALPETGKPYPAVSGCLKSICAAADVVAVSSANDAAVDSEWQKHGLKQYTRLLCCQGAGSKTEIIKKLLTFGYEPRNVLMVGDAMGDKSAAEANGVWFYPILTGDERRSWERLVEEAIPRLLGNTFDNTLQQTYNMRLERAFTL